MRYEKQYPKCRTCKGPCKLKSDSLVREDGRFICKGCWDSEKKYRDHWFVRSLRYKKPSVKSTRGRKPFPGQKDLEFDPEDHHE